MRVKVSILATAACALWLAIPMSAASKHMTTATPSAWAPETLNGTITMVDPQQKLVVVQAPGQVPFDLVVTARTRIRSGNQAISLQELTQDTNKTVSVQYTPERSGDVAKSIRITG